MSAALPLPLLAALGAAASAHAGGTRVIEGDASLVTAVTGWTGRPGWGLRMDGQRQDLAAVARRVIDGEGDRFDFIAVVPAFPDLLNPGLASFIRVRSDDAGTGVPPIDRGRAFGSEARLQGVLNLNHPRAYRERDGREIDDPGSLAPAVAAHELAHRWLAFARVDVAGVALLGREGSHWSALLDTGVGDGEAPSLMDGVAWRDDGGGCFTAVDVFLDPGLAVSPRARFSPLDLYLMGLAPARAVPPFFVIVRAVGPEGPVARHARIPPGTVVAGERVDLTVDDVVAALGPRVPDAAHAQRRFNTAFVVVTAPGQPAQAAADDVNRVDRFRRAFEARFREWTGGLGEVCTGPDGECSP